MSGRNKSKVTFETLEDKSQVTFETLEQSMKMKI